MGCSTSTAAAARPAPVGDGAGEAPVAPAPPAPPRRADAAPVTRVHVANAVPDRVVRGVHVDVEVCAVASEYFRYACLSDMAGHDRRVAEGMPTLTSCVHNALIDSCRSSRDTPHIDVQLCTPSRSAILGPCAVERSHLDATVSCALRAVLQRATAAAASKVPVTPGDDTIAACRETVAEQRTAAAAQKVVRVHMFTARDCGGVTASRAASRVISNVRGEPDELRTFDVFTVGSAGDTTVKPWSINGYAVHEWTWLTVRVEIGAERHVGGAETTSRSIGSDASGAPAAHEQWLAHPRLQPTWTKHRLEAVKAALQVRDQVRDVPTVFHAPSDVVEHADAHVLRLVKLARCVGGGVRIVGNCDTPTVRTNPESLEFPVDPCDVLPVGTTLLDVSLPIAVHLFEDVVARPPPAPQAGCLRALMCDDQKLLCKLADAFMNRGGKSLGIPAGECEWVQRAWMVPVMLHLAGQLPREYAYTLRDGRPVDDSSESERATLRPNPRMNHEYCGERIGAAEVRAFVRSDGANLGPRTLDEFVPHWPRSWYAYQAAVPAGAAAPAAAAAGAARDKFDPRAPYDIVAIDIMLPFEDGTCLSRDLHSAGCTVPLWAYTGQSLSLRQLEEFGFRGYFPKPTASHQLIGETWRSRVTREAETVRKVQAEARVALAISRGPVSLARTHDAADDGGAAAGAGVVVASDEAARRHAVMRRLPSPVLKTVVAMLIGHSPWGARLHDYEDAGVGPELGMDMRSQRVWGGRDAAHMLRHDDSSAGGGGAASSADSEGERGRQVSAGAGRRG